MQANGHRSGCPINLATEVLGDKWSFVVLRDVSEAAAAVGIEPGSAEAREIAGRLAEVELGD